jgi:nucleoid DNA-binding protein
MAVVLSDIVDGIAKAVKLTRPESRVVADRILDAIADGLSRGEDFEIRNFGTFRTRVVSGKVGRHLTTGAMVILPPTRKVSFKAGKFLKPVRTDDPPQGLDAAPGDGAAVKAGPEKGRDKKETVDVPMEKPGSKKPGKVKGTPVDGEQTTLWGV